MIVGIAGGDASNPEHLQIVDNYFEKLINCYDVVWNMMIIVNNTILYNLKAAKAVLIISKFIMV